MSMESIKKIIAENPGILQCNLKDVSDLSFSGSQITKLVRNKEIIRIQSTRKNAGSSYALYLARQ